ncbi:MAG: hypothetical protein M0Z40_03990 [Actinomycetota bacterium]|nr:hypothetical protein [Actinomycetota bacterium]MDA8074385.1 hypothetical protein [Actinomycetota bacterium]
MSHPDGLPDLFLDRSLGRRQVPALLRSAGLRLVTLAERYGVPEDEGIEDVRWLQDVGERGEVAFKKDERIRYNSAEKAAVVAFGVRGFYLTRQDLTAQAMADRFLDNLDAIVDACAAPGPFLYAVNQRDIRRVDLS